MLMNPVESQCISLFVLEIYPSTMKPHRPGTEQPIDGRKEYFTTGQNVRCVAAQAGQSAITGGYSVNKSHEWRSDVKVIWRWHAFFHASLPQPFITSCPREPEVRRNVMRINELKSFTDDISTQNLCHYYNQLKKILIVNLKIMKVK